MFWVVRKATSKVVGYGVSEDSLDVFLSILPTGVYGIENSDGIEISVAIVKGGRVKFAVCNGPKPEATVVSTSAVVKF